jgi:NADH:ubiquinone oxidoreductase subunit 6 (subunit J)
MALAIIFAILTIELKDLIYMVFSFAIMSVAIGSFYFLLNAVYLAMFQMLVYAGAVVAMAIAAIILTRGREK